MSRFDQLSDFSKKSFLHRGGRIVKWKGGTASMVPHFAELRLSVSATAVGAALMFGTGMVGTTSAMAGACAETVPLSGEFVCSGPAGADATQVLNGVPATVTTEADFGITVAAGDAMEINGFTRASFEDAQASVITGLDNGIIITNAGSGSLSLTSNGTIAGLQEDGINAFNGAGAIDLTITTNLVSGGNNGIDAFNNGTGVLAIDSTGAITGGDSDGINAFNSAYGTDLAINVVDSGGDENGIAAFNDGSGALTISSTGTVAGDDFDGIDARNSVNGTDLTINAVDTNGGGHGIYADNDGTGALTIVSTGTATGIADVGIYAVNSNNGTDLTINAVDSSGDRAGISAQNFGSGALTITSTGTAIGTIFNGIGTYNSAASTDLTITAVDTYGGESGIGGTNFGSGALTISSTGTATGANFDGIFAFNYANGTDLTVNAFDSSGGTNGINAENRGSGALTIISTGTATGNDNDGIDAENDVTGTDLTINAFDTSGVEHGIDAINTGSGALTITSTGTATGINFDGIDAYNVLGTNLTVNAFDTNGAEHGIDAFNAGTGALTVTSTGTATGANDDGIDARNSANGTDLTVDAVDTSGGGSGILAANDGTGALTVTSTGTATGTFYSGINVFNSAAGTSLTITAVNATGGTRGILARNFGTAGLTISISGDVTGQNLAGVYAYNSANDISGSMEINQAEGTTITGATDGIYANNLGGSLTINALGTVVGLADDGIDARNGVGTTDLTITSNVATGAANGIFAANSGTGALRITSTGTATGTNDDGIVAFNSANGTDLAINAVDSSGGENGINAFNDGSGALTITSTGTATGTDFDGINAVTSATSTDLTINAADTSGGNYGIEASNFGTGALTINSTGTATGTNYDGIDATNSANGTDLTVNAVDSSGNNNGINARNNGSGALTVTSTGTATGTIFDGIEVFNSANGTGVTVNSVDSSGGENGIEAFNEGAGALRINSTGIATGFGLDGINAFNTASGTGLSVSAADTIGNGHGIDAFNQGSGALTITSTGTATGTNLDGIEATNFISGTDLTINAVDTNGGQNGIDADNNGGGALTIISTGMAIGIADDGIEANNTGNGTDLTINAVDTSGNDNGIDAANDGSGALTITSTGTAMGATSNGIGAFNSVIGTDLTVNAADSTGNINGIDAVNIGSGALTITSTGTATGTTFYGIDAFNNANGTDLSVNAVDTSGGEIGIDASNNGSGALTVMSTGTATGTGFAGIRAINSASGTSLTITAMNATGGAYGIGARNLGTAGLTITTSGDITGETQAGVDAYNSANDVSGSMEINQADGTTITGATDGIYADNLGGSLTINALGTVVGLADDGIDARNGVGTTDLTIASNVATGANNGILADNDGTGALRISSTGMATGTALDGIDARNSVNGTDLSISAMDTSGGRDGIDARNEGSGALTITSTGTATGTDFNGIVALTNANGTSLTVNAADTNGGRYGIYANNEGSGVLTITSTGAAIGTDFDGINADNSANGTDLTIDASDSSGGEHGIDALNNGSGALTITSTGTATGVALDGIEAFNSANGTDVMVNAVDTNGNNIGIDAQNNGSGALRVSSTGTATGTGFDGINALNSASGTGLTVSAADSSGGENGIDAVNYGSGALTITSTGRASGATLNGITASNSANGGALTITAGDVSGGIDGIYASQQGVDPLVVTTGGTVAGGTGNGITATTSGAAITVSNSGTLESGAGFALAASGGVTDLTNSGTINGRVQLSAFDDVVVNSGQFNAAANSDFGAGNDLFTNDGTVTVGGTVAFNGLEQFINNDLIAMQNGAIGNSLTIAGDYVGNGTLELDVSFDGAGSADRLIVAGAASGNTALFFNDISASPNFGNTVLVVDADAGTTEDAFALGDPAATIGFLSYSLSFDAAGNDFFLSNAIGTPVFQALKFVEGAQSLWYRSADAWAAHMASPNTDTGSPAWMQVYGSITNQEDSFDFTSGGFTQDISLDYDQDYFGFQLGYEFGSGVAGDGALFGFTSGYLNSNLGFEGSADNVDYDAFNIGAYAGFKSDGFFANALIKYDFIDADINARTAGYTADLNGDAYGIRVEAGYRWGDEGFFVQPLASLEYQQASLDDFSALGADIDFDKYDGFRGMAGVRLGGESKVNGSNTLTYYAGGQAVHQSQTDDGLLFTSGASSIQIDNRLSNTFGRFELGLNIASPDGVSGFIEGNADISGDYTGYGGRAGLKIQF